MQELQTTIARESHEIHELRSQLSFYISSQLFEADFDTDEAVNDMAAIKHSLNTMRQAISDGPYIIEELLSISSGVGRLAQFSDANVANEIIFGYQTQMTSNEQLISAQKSEIEELRLKIIKQEDKNFSEVLKLQSLERIVLERDITAQEVKEIEGEVGRVVSRLREENQALRKEIDFLQARLQEPAPIAESSPEPELESPLNRLLPPSLPSPKELELIKIMHNNCEERSKSHLNSLSKLNRELEAELSLQRSKIPAPTPNCSECRYKRQILDYREIIDCLREEIAILKRELRLWKK